MSKLLRDIETVYYSEFFEAEPHELSALLLKSQEMMQYIDITDPAIKIYSEIVVDTVQYLVKEYDMDTMDKLAVILHFLLKRRALEVGK